jgi:hypothetical protein
MRNGRFNGVDGLKWEILVSTRFMYVVVFLTHPGFHLKIARAQSGVTLGPSAPLILAIPERQEKYGVRSTTSYLWEDCLHFKPVRSRANAFPSIRTAYARVNATMMQQS